MPTESERVVTSISSNVFFAEFTFDKNQFKSKDGELELADNVLWLDDLLFVIQVKERNPSEVKTAAEENKWFEKVTKKAKKQIGDSITFLKSYDGIKIKNLRNHEIEISKPSVDKVNKVIIYVPISDLISEENRFTKFYESSQVGNVHIFHVEDYLWVCKYLVTPTELDEYLKFRERIYLKHKSIISVFPEQYVLSHFLNTRDESVIREEYIETLTTLDQDTTEWDMSGVIKHFPNSLVVPEGSSVNDYYAIIKEIAKLSRFELKHFKERFTKMIEDGKNDIMTFPYRFALSRTGCGFVFIPLVKETARSWRDALVTFTEIFKYKWKLKRCLGVCASYDGTYFDINWAFIERDWAYDEQLDEAVTRDSAMYGQGDIVDLGRYRFKDNEE
jgi:hypothetical protein